MFPSFTFVLKLGMMEKFGIDEKDKEVCVVYQGEQVRMD